MSQITLKSSLALILGIINISVSIHAQELLPSRQVLIMARPNTISLREGIPSANIADISVVQDLRSVLQNAYINTIARAMPDFSSSDTLRVLEDGHIYRTRNYTNLYIVNVPLSSLSPPFDIADPPIYNVP